MMQRLVHSPVRSVVRKVVSPALGEGVGEWVPGQPMTLFVAGDSRAANGRTGSTVSIGGYQTLRYGAAQVACYRLLGKGTLFDGRTNLFATVGNKTSDWISTHQSNLVTAVAAAVNPVVLFQLGTNDLGASVALATIQANILSIAAALRGANPRCHVVWFLESPRSGASALGSGDEQNRKDLNAWLLTQVGTFFKVVDYLAAFTSDGTFNGATAAAGMQRDDLHDATLGADVKAQAAAAVLSALAPVVAGVAYVGDTDTYNASTNPKGNKVANGQMSGGTTVPTSWNGEVRNAADSGAATGITCTFSKASANVARMAIGGTGVNGEKAQLRQSTVGNLTGYAAGDVLRARARVSWTGLANVKAIRLRCTLFGDFFGGLIGDTGSGPMPNTAGEEVMEWVGVMQAGNVNDRFQINLEVVADGVGVPAGTIDWSAAEIRKVNAASGS